MARVEDRPATSPGKKKLSLDEIEQLQEQYRDVALADDEDGKSIRRAVLAKLRRVTHEELHPECRMVEFNVPQAVDGSFFKINEKPYIGRVVVWECVARELAGLIDRNRRVDAERLREGGRMIDLGPIADRARLIQAET